MNSCPLSCRMRPRVIRAIYVQPFIPNAMLIVMIPGFRTSMARTTTITLGMPFRISMPRCITSSILPPKSPEAAP
jgi:hypothetical protein